MEWTTEKPTKPGWYWIWTPETYAKGVTCIEIVEHMDELYTYYPCVTGNELQPLRDDIEASNITHFMGPLQAPEPPKDVTK